VVAKAAVIGGSGTNCIAVVGMEYAVGGGRLVNLWTTAVATAMITNGCYLVGCEG